VKREGIKRKGLERKESVHEGRIKTEKNKIVLEKGVGKTWKKIKEKRIFMD